jgi:glycerol-3-phosphate acyltransferase PlsX
VIRVIVIKSHGSADKHAFCAAIKRATEEVRGGMLRHISEHIAELQHNIKKNKFNSATVE